MENDEQVPLSSGQRGMWRAEQAIPGSGINNLATAYRLRGRLDRPALEGAVEALVRRHELLRTVVDRREGGEFQGVRPAGPVPPLRDDTSGSADPYRAAFDRAVRFAGEPYPLDRRPPLRWALIRLGADDHLMVLCLHHIAADGRSEAIIHREISAAYIRLTTGRGAEPPVLAVQYADFAAEQDRRRGTDAFRADLDTWRRRLADAPASIALPFDRAPDTRSGPAARTRRYAVPEPIRAAVADLARRERTSPFAVLLSAFAVLLARRCRQPDLVIGVPVAGRDRPEFEELVGRFVNTLPIRLRVDAARPFRDLVAETSIITRTDLARRETPFDDILDVVRPVREPGRSPLVQVLFQVHDTPAGRLELPGLRVDAEPVLEESAGPDLSLSWAENDDGRHAYWKYRTDLFDPVTIDRWHAALVAVLTSVTADPLRTADSGPVMSEVELRTVVQDWNDTDATYDRALLPALFERQVARTPDAPAVRDRDGTLTFHELNVAANRIARTLRRRGAGPDTIVGILLERSHVQLASVLGVLKAGGAYLPLDPSHPPRRTAMMTSDAKPLLTITDDARRRLLPDDGTAPVLDLDAAELDEDGSDLPDPGATPDNLAYVIYTSGTTGRPKGAAITHAGLSNHLQWAPEAFEHGGRDGAPVHSPLAFDFTVTPMYLPLLHGRCLDLLPESDSLDRLAEALLRPDADFSVVKLTPAHLEALRARFEPGTRLSSVRTLILGGEQLHAETVAAWRKLAPDAVFVNEYGPTETVVCCTTVEIPRELRAGPVPIGRPTANARLYVLDERLRPVPAGSVGEIYIGGPGVARGYLNRPALTAERFGPDPFGSGGRLYRTGDLARWSADGLLEFRGRVDHQVKLRGFRIELGEIENTLLRDAAVKEAAVVLREDVPGDPALVGYWTPAALPAVATDTLLAHLRATLPEHMVPTALIRLDELPLTGHGKLDRARLPRPAPAAQRAGEPPRPGTEATVAAVWSDVLGSPPGRTDDFFDLGRHSLRAARIASRITRLFGGVTHAAVVNRLFETPTVAGLSAWLDGLAVPAVGAGDLPPLTPDAPVPLSSAQRRLWFLDQLDPGRAEYAVPLMLRLDGPLDEPALRTALDRLVERHAALRTTIAETVGEPVIRLLPPGPVPMTVTTVDGPGRDARLAELLRTEAGHGIALGEGLPLRVRLLRLGATEHVLCLTLHHIATDAFSVRVLIDDLCALYAEVRGTAPAPAAPPHSYAEYTAWTRLPERRAEIARSAAYWRTQLADLPTLRLPADRVRPERRAAIGARHASVLDRALVVAVDTLASAHGATRFMVLLAAFQVLLARHSGQRDVVVGTTVHGRNHPDAERLIGCFINMLVLRGDLSGTPSFAELVDRTRRIALAAYAHQEVPFDEVVEMLDVRRDLSRTPLFQVMMQLVDRDPGAGREAAGLTVRETDAPTLFTKYDLTLSFRPQGEELLVEFEYDTALFTAPTIARLARQLHAVLRQAIARPDRPITELELPDAGERAQAPAAGRGAIAGDLRGRGDRAETPVTHTPPSSTAERAVAAIWQELLETPELDIDSDFFTIGGSSLLATRVIARMRAAFGAQLPLGLIFVHPTVRGLAQAVEDAILAELDEAEAESADPRSYR